MWELDHKEGWTLKNQCFRTVVLEKTLESPLDCKEIQPVNPIRNQPWLFIGRTDAETLIFWPPDGKSWLSGKDPEAEKDWGHEEKGMTEDEMFGWHHQLDEQVWASSGRSWRTAKAGMLQSMWSWSRTQLSDWTTTSTLSIKINDIVSVLKKFGI